MKNILLILIILLLLIPVPVRYKDGGSVEYRAVLYQIKDVHCISPGTNSNEQYIEGIQIKILGIEVFNNSK